MKASEFLKRYEKQRGTAHEDEPLDEEDHSLQAQAKKRAAHPQSLHAGTAFDWEDLDRYQKEISRLEREGPKTSGEEAKNSSGGNKH